MRKQLIDPDALIRSLRCAIKSTKDHSRSIISIKRSMSKCPSGTLRILHDGRYIRFYERSEKKKIFLKKETDRVYLLARKLYLGELIEVLETASLNMNDSTGSEHKLRKLEGLINDFSKGNLDLARIAFAPKQYQWFTGEYRRKKIVTQPGTTLLKTDYDNTVRSKSEQTIDNTLWNFAVPCHYEERLQIDVRSVVNKMEMELRQNGWRENNIFYFRNGSCFWNVPRELQFMNAPGSAWHTFNYKTGLITVYPDFTIMLADGTRLYWEHEGMLDKVIYRINAMDRIFLMRSAGGIDPMGIIETEEKDSIDRDALETIIKTRIIPGLWF